MQPAQESQLPPEVAAADAEAQGATQDAMAASVPPARSPLSPDKVNALGAALNDAKETLGAGQVPVVNYGEFGGEPLDALPVEMFSELMVLRQFVDKLGQGGVNSAKRYKFDPVAAATDDAGLTTAIAEIRNLSMDKEILAIMENAAGPPAEEAQPAPAEQPAGDEYEGLV